MEIKEALLMGLPIVPNFANPLCVIHSSKLSTYYTNNATIFLKIINPRF